VTIRTLREVFIPGASELPERLRTLTVTPTRFVEPGTTVEATFGFYNSGGATATGLRVRFAHPDGLQYIAGSARVDGVPVTDQDGISDDAFVGATGALLGEIAPGVERRVSVLYRVAELIEDGTTLALQAAIAANETTVVGSNIIRLVARSRPHLQNPQTLLTIEAPSGAEPGRELLVRARIVNLGQSSATDVVLIFPVPEHTRYAPRSARIDGRTVVDERGAPFEAAASTVIAERLLPGQTVVADFIAAIESPLDNGTAITAVARLSSREIPEFEMTSNAITVASMPSFDGDGTAFLIDGDDEVVPGMRLRMALRVANVGTSSARRVIAQITLPNGLAYSPGSATLDGLPLADELFDAMGYAFESIAPGHALQLAFDAVVVAPAPADAKLPVAARVSWESGERTFSRTLTIRSEPRFTRVKNIVERGGAPLAHPGDEVTFLIRIVNEGTADASDARIRLRLDDALTLIGAHSNEESLQVADAAIDLGVIVPHLEHQIAVVARVASPIADRSEVALAAELVTRQVGVTDLGVASYVVRSRPRFSIDETRLVLRTTDPLRPKSPVQVAMQIVNTGTDIARDVRAILTAPPEVSIEAIGGAPLIHGELLFDALPPGVFREALVELTPRGILPNGSIVTIEARVEAAELAPLPLRPLSIESRAEADFAGEISLKSTPPDAVDAGAPFSYALRFRNVGDGPAQSVVVRIRPPEHVVYVPASTRVNQMRVDDENGTSPLWSLHGLILTDVDPGIPVVIAWESIVTSPIASGTVLSAAATLQWDEKSLTVVSDDVIVRSTPEFASSPGGRSISIARLAGQSLTTQQEPAMLPQPRPVASIALGAAPQGALPEAAPVAAIAAHAPPTAISSSASSADEAALDMPFFTAPPSEHEESDEEPRSHFEYLDEHPEHDETTDSVAHVSHDLVVSHGEDESIPVVAHLEADSHVEAYSEHDVDVEDDRQNDPVHDSEEHVATTVVDEDREQHQPSHEDDSLAVPVIAHSESPDGRPMTILAFAPDRLRRTLGFLQQSDYGKLVSHFFALEAFFPDRILNAPELDELFVGVRDAFRSTLDRLFVRLRLPRYTISSRDLEDRSSRDTMLALVERIVELEHEEPTATLGAVQQGIRISGPCDFAALSHAVEALAEAPLGGVTPWIACASLLGTTIENEQGDRSPALGIYRQTLLDVLRALEALPMSEFHRVLTSGANAQLDQALQAVVQVLHDPLEVAAR